MAAVAVARRGGRPPDVRPFSAALLIDAVGAPSIVVAARNLGLHRKQLYRWIQSGLTVDQADTLACRAGLHPAEIWPDW